MISGHTGVEESLRRERRIPHGRLTGLRDQVTVGILDEKVVDRLDAFRDPGMIIGIAGRAKCHRAVHHRGLDATPAAVSVLMLDRPLAGSLERTLAESRRAQVLPELEDPVEAKERVLERECVEPAIHLELLGRGGVTVELRNGEPRGGRNQWLVGHQHEQRNECSPTPARHLVDTETRPGRNEHKLDGQRRHRGPRHLPEVGEEDLGEHAGALEAAGITHEAARPEHLRGFRIGARKSKRCVGLDGHVLVAGAVLEERPAPVAILRGADVLENAPLGLPAAHGRENG